MEKCKLLHLVKQYRKSKQQLPSFSAVAVSEFQTRDARQNGTQLLSNSRPCLRATLLTWPSCLKVRFPQSKLDARCDSHP